MVEMRDQLR